MRKIKQSSGLGDFMAVHKKNWHRLRWEKLFRDSLISIYKGKERHSEDVEKMFCEKGYRGKPVTELQKLGNKIKSRIRCRIAHIFGFMTNAKNALKIRCIGKQKADFNIGIANMVYNMCRLSTLKR